MYDTRSSDEKQMQKDVARDERKLAGVEKLLRQFLTVETGQGKSAAYRRGYEFSFEWSEEDRKKVLSRMDNQGESFDEAFAAVSSLRKDLQTVPNGSGEDVRKP